MAKNYFKRYIWLKVLASQWLRDEMKEIIEDMMSNYVG